MKITLKAFTLVELMIVVVILTILGSIGFISYEDYLVDARDSKRIAHLTGLRDAMRLTSTKKSLPLPDASIEIRNNGIGFLHQGYAGKTVLESVGFSETTQDPFDEVFYTYLVSENKKDFQLLGFLEKYNPDLLISSVSQSYAVNYTNRVINTVGKKLGVLVQQISNTPLQELLPYTASGYIDLSTDTSGKKFDAYVTDTYVISGTGSALTGIIPFTTCKKISEIGHNNGNGFYVINPSGVNPMKAYCDMTTEGGGWTLVMRLTNTPEANQYTGGFGWTTSAGNVQDDIMPYSMGTDLSYINFSEMMITGYSSGKNISKFIFTYNITKSEFYTLNASDKKKTLLCETIQSYVKDPGVPTTPQLCTTMNIFGDIYSSPTFWTGGRYSTAQGFNVGTNFSINLNGAVGMIFVR